MSTPEGVSALRGYVSRLNSESWDAGRWPLEQVAAFAHVHSDLMTGAIARVLLTAFGATPAADRQRQANAAALGRLPRPFTAEIDMDL